MPEIQTPQAFSSDTGASPASSAASAFFSRRSQAREQAKQQNHSFHLFCTTMFKYSTSVSRFLQNPFPSPGRPWAATAKTSFSHLDELAPKKVTAFPHFNSSPPQKPKASAAPIFPPQRHPFPVLPQKTRRVLPKGELGAFFDDRPAPRRRMIPPWPYFTACP